MSNLSNALRKNCIWQRTKETDRDSYYPYVRHLADCSICQSADRIEELENQKQLLINHCAVIGQELTDGNILEDMANGSWCSLSDDLTDAIDIATKNLERLFNE